MMLGYHEFSDAREKDVYALMSERFRTHARIVREKYGVEPRITFDDGPVSQFVIARPILNEFALPAMFFITTAWVAVRQSVMTWEQIRELRRLGHLVGSHTHTHPLLTACGSAAMRDELSISKRILEDRLGNEVTTISIPGGRSNTRVYVACADAGYKHVYTSRVGEYRAANGTSPEVIGRFIVTRGTSEQRLASYLEGDPGTLRRLQLDASAKRLVKAVIGDSIYQKAWSRAVRSQSYRTRDA